MAISIKYSEHKAILWKTASVLALFMGSLGLYASQDSLFQMGNAHYEEKHYAEAEKAYKAIEDSGVYSVALFFNLGNVYYKKGDIGRAVLYYKRALRLNPNDEDARFNLRMAEEAGVSKVTPVPEPWYKRLYISVISNFSSNHWAAFALVSAIFLLGFWLLFLARKLGFLPGIFGLSLFSIFLIVGLLGAFGAHELSERKTGVLIEPSIMVKSAPSKDAEDIFIIHAGVSFELVESYQDWCKVRLSNGNLGWIPARVFEEV